MSCTPNKTLHFNNRPSSKSVIPEISAWLNLSREEQNRLKTAYFNPASFYHIDLIKYILQAVQPSSFSNSEIHNVQKAPNHFSSIKHIDKSTADTENDIKKLNKELTVYSRSLYKAAARYIRKHLLKKHKKCIQKLMSEIDGKEICPLAFAYVMWRRDLEGLQNYWQVHTHWKLVKRKYDNDHDAVSLYNSTNNFFGQYLYGGKHKLTYQKQQEMKWVYGRIAWLSMFSHFVKWTRVAEEWAKKRMFYHQLQLEDKDMPFHLTILQDNKNKPTEFHWWVEKDYIDFLNKVNCPIGKLSKSSGHC